MVDLPQPDSPTSPRVSWRLHLQGHAGDRRHVPDRAAEHAAADREVLDEVGGDEQRAVADVTGAVAASTPVVRRPRSLGRLSAP